MQLKRKFCAFRLALLLGAFPLAGNCQENVTGAHREKEPSVSVWLTNPDKSALFQEQPGRLQFRKATASTASSGAASTTASDGAAGAYPTIEVNTARTFQSMDGFGFALTGGSASLIDGLKPAARAALLRELFSTGKGCIGISYLRISIGASDLDPEVFTYDDMPAGEKDPGLTRFSIDRDKQHLIPVLRSILALNPRIQILGSPWSAPSWMKDNEATSGGHLDPVYYKAYARYLVKYIRAMKAAGIPIAAITPQNEPMNPRNNPSMVMTDTAEANFVGTALGPAFRAAGCAAKIIVWDHNCDLPEYPLYILRDAKAARYVDGSAFHLYRGEISAMSKVHHAFPEKRLYFTEEYTAGGSDFGGDLSWHIANLIIGAPRNWARNVLEWNLAADSLLEPHTPGGCSTCMGALTIGDSVTRNVSYYIIAHASRFVRPGSVRVASTVNADLPNVAFQTPDGRKVLIVLNQAGDNRTFHISFKGRQATTSLMAGAVATYVW